MSNPSSSSRASAALLLCFAVSLVGACNGDPSSNDGGVDAASACTNVCSVNATCDTSGTTPVCVCNHGYIGDGSFCDVAPTCTPACGANATCQANLACACDAGYHGDPLAGCVNTPVDACQPRNPCLNGGSCTVSGSGYTCTCVAGSSGTNCEVPPSTSCGTYTDIVYAVTASFEVRDTPAMIGDQKFTDLTTNASTPPFQQPTNTTPFRRNPDPTPVFTRGFVRLRYSNDATGKPVAGTVRLVEYYVPMEFTQTAGATLIANTDQSVGILDTSLSNCGGGDPPCTSHAPALARTCAPNARGLLVGRTLTWDACTPVPTGLATWDYVMARAATGPGCATRFNAWGSTETSSPLVPAGGKGDSFQTWNQQLQGFVLSGTDPMTATITMPEMQVPNGTGTGTTWVAITGSSIVATDCGTAPGTDLLCNVQ